MSNADKIKAALERIEQGLATINTDEDWISFLRFQSLFYQYSLLFWAYGLRQQIIQLCGLL